MRKIFSNFVCFSESPNFTVNNLFKIPPQGRHLAPLFGNGTKVKIPSEIKPPLGRNELPLLGSCFKSFQENLIFQFLKYFCSKQCLIFLDSIHDIQIIYPIIDWKSLVCTVLPFLCVFFPRKPRFINQL